MKRMTLFLITFILICGNVSASAISFAGPIQKPQRNISLMYHRLSENPADWGAFCTSPAQFENDLKVLKQEGYIFCTASELAEFARQGDFSRKRVAVTFDDGYASDYIYALPALERQQAKASFFIIGNRLDTPDYLSSEQLKLLAASPLAEIGNHSYALHDVPYTALRRMYHTSEATSDIWNDFSKNKKLLETITGRRIVSLSYPSGIYSDAVDRQLKKEYQTTISTKEYDITRGDFPLPRYNRYHGASLHTVLRDK